MKIDTISPRLSGRHSKHERECLLMVYFFLKCFLSVPFLFAIYDAREKATNNSASRLVTNQLFFCAVSTVFLAIHNVPVAHNLKNLLGDKLLPGRWLHNMSHTAAFPVMCPGETLPLP